MVLAHLPVFAILLSIFALTPAYSHAYPRLLPLTPVPIHACSRLFPLLLMRNY